MKKTTKVEKKYANLKGLLLIMGFVVLLMLSPLAMNRIDELKTRQLVSKEITQYPSVKKWYIYGYADGDPLSQGFQLVVNFENESTGYMSFWSLSPKDFKESNEIYLDGVEYNGKKFSPRLTGVSRQDFSCGSQSSLNLLSPPVKELLEIKDVNNIHGLIENREKILSKLSQVPVSNVEETNQTGGVILKNYCPGKDAALYLIN